MKKQYTTPEIKVIAYYAPILSDASMSAKGDNISSPSQMGGKYAGLWEEDEDW